MPSSKDDQVTKLQRQVDLLQKIITSNKMANSIPTQISPLPVPSNPIKKSILDYKTDKYMLHSINVKPSSVQIGTSFRPSFTTKCIVDFKSKMASNPSTAWKISMKNDDFYISDISSPFASSQLSLEKVDEKIRSIFIYNYYGILERLIYFQNELNELIFNSCIPCGVLHMVFNNYFRPSIDGIAFVPPKKLHEYQPLALILAVVDLVEIFTKYEKHISFSQILQVGPFELSQVALETLNFTKFRKKQTYFGLMGIITLRLTFIHYGHFNSGFTHQNEYSYFQTAVNMAISMGLDKDLDKHKFFIVHNNVNDENNFSSTVPFECLKKLWNYILLGDIQFSLFGPTPMINLDFSHGFYPEVIDSNDHELNYQKLIYSILKKMSLSEGKTLRDFVNCCDSIKAHCAKLISFGDVYFLANNKKTWPQVLNKLYSLKIILELYAFAGSQSSACGRIKVFSPEQLLDPKTGIELDKIHKHFKDYATVIYIFALKFISEVLKCNNDPKFVIYMRNLFWIYLIKPSIGMINLAIEPGNHIKPGEMEVNISLTDLEKIIFSDKEVPSEIVNYYSSPHILKIEILNLFQDVMSVPMMVSNYDFYSNARFTLVLICFLKAYNKYTFKGDFRILNALQSIPVLMVGIYEQMIQKFFFTKGEVPTMNTNLMAFESYAPNTPSSTRDSLSDYMSATFADIDSFQNNIPLSNDDIRDYTF